METINEIIESLITAGHINIEQCDVDWTTEDVGRYQLGLAKRIKNAITFTGQEIPLIMQENPLNNLIEPTTGIVHLMMPNSGGEYTLCGDAFDRPHTEDGQESMQDTTKPCNCYKCISAMNLLIPYFRKEKRRVSTIINNPFDIQTDL